MCQQGPRAGVAVEGKRAHAPMCKACQSQGGRHPARSALHTCHVMQGWHTFQGVSVPSLISFSSSGQYFWHGVCAARTLCMSSDSMPPFWNRQQQHEAALALRMRLTPQQPSHICCCDLIEDLGMVANMPVLPLCCATPILALSKRRSAYLASSHVKGLLHEPSQLHSMSPSQLGMDVRRSA